MTKFMFLKLICLLLIAAKLFVSYDISWFEVFIPLYVAFAVETLKVLLEHLETYFKKVSELEEKVKQHGSN